MIEKLRQYMQHLPTCCKEQDWTEAQQALGDCPEGPERDLADAEMRTRMNTCTCGMEAVYENIEERYFSPDQIAIIQEAAYYQGTIANNN